MANPIQWGVDELYTTLDNIVQGAAVERAQISMNNQNLIDLNAKVQALPASAQKNTMIAWINTSVARQAQIVSSYRTLSANFASLATQAESWLKSVGLTPSVPAPTSLSGLGVAPALILVPVAIVGLAAAAWAAVAWIHESNAAQISAINAHQQAFNTLVSKGATVDQLLQFQKDADAATKDLMPKTPDPFSKVTDMITLMMIAGGVFMLLPMLRDMMPKRSAA
jgi:hypothetical protein